MATEKTGAGDASMGNLTSSLMHTEDKQCGSQAGEPMDITPEAMLEEEEEHLAVSRSSTDDTVFDAVIGHIEDIIMDEEFQMMQQDFLEKYYGEFDDTEENKFIYTDIHREYLDLIEKYLNKQLVQRMPDFNMAVFSSRLLSRKEELDGEVFEMLLTFSDFVTFKEMFLDYKAEKEGNTVDFSSGITVTSLAFEPSIAPGPIIQSLTPSAPDQ